MVAISKRKKQLAKKKTVAEKKNHLKNVKRKQRRHKEVKIKKTSDQIKENLTTDTDAEKVKRRVRWKPKSKEEIELPNDLKTQISKSVSALLQLTSEREKKLFSNEGEPIFLQLTSVKVPQTPERQIRFVLPHPLRTSTSEVCLFVSDLVKGKKTDHEPTVEHFRQILEEKGVKVVNEIIPLRQLKVEYDQYELKRSLCNRYDFFLSEAKISGHILHFLGKVFHQKKKVPVPVNLKAPDLSKQIFRALSKTALKVNSKGCVFIVQVAHTAQAQEDIEMNINAAAESIAREFPGGWENIRSLMIKTAKSLAIPIFMTLKPPNLVPIPIVKPRRPAAAKAVTGELSTMPGVTVKVLASGKVLIEGVENSDEEWSDNEVDHLVDTEIKAGNRKLKNPRKRLAESAHSDGESGDNEESTPAVTKKTKKKKKKTQSADQQESESKEEKLKKGTKKGGSEIADTVDKEEESDDDNELQASEVAYLSTWLLSKEGSKDLEEDKQEDKKLKGNKSKKSKTSGQSKMSKKPLKKKLGQVKPPSKVQKKFLKTKEVKIKGKKKSL